MKSKAQKILIYQQLLNTFEKVLMRGAVDNSTSPTVIKAWIANEVITSMQLSQNYDGSGLMNLLRNEPLQVNGQWLDNAILYQNLLSPEGVFILSFLINLVKDLKKIAVPSHLLRAIDSVAPTYCFIHANPNERVLYEQLIAWYGSIFEMKTALNTYRVKGVHHTKAISMHEFELIRVYWLPLKAAIHSAMTLNGIKSEITSLQNVQRIMQFFLQILSPAVSALTPNIHYIHQLFQGMQTHALSKGYAPLQSEQKVRLILWQILEPAECYATFKAHLGGVLLPLSQAIVARINEKRVTQNDAVDVKMTYYLANSVVSVPCFAADDLRRQDPSKNANFKLHPIKLNL